MKNAAQRVFSRPLLGSLLTTIPFFVFFLAVLRPGYVVDDDVDMIFLVSGYLGGKPVPFMVFSNVLLGFVLKPLYALPTHINWEIWLFILINFLSVWALLYVILARPLNAVHKLFGVVAVLLCDAYFLINITFTTIAAFAIIAGYCLILMAVPRQAALKKAVLISGIALAVVGSLIRIELAPFILALILPAVMLCFRSFDIKNTLIAVIITAALISGCYAFDRWYLRSSPDWSAYDIYNNTRSSIQDTPRQENINLKYREVGWKVNDLKAFVNSFFPDESIFSLTKLQYLVDHVSDKKKTIIGPAAFFVTRLFGPEFLPYLLLVGSIWIAMWLYGLSKKALLPLSALLASFFVINLYLSWSQKSPDRILLPSLVAGVVFGMCILDWSGLNRDLPLSATGNKVFARLGFGGIIAALIIAAALISFQSTQTTS